MLEGDSSEATAAADAKKGAVVDDEEFVDEELDDFSTEKLVYKMGEIMVLSRLHGDIHENWSPLFGRENFPIWMTSQMRRQLFCQLPNELHSQTIIFCTIFPPEHLIRTRDENIWNQRNEEKKLFTV